MAMFVNLRVEELSAQNTDVDGNLNVDGAAVVDGLVTASGGIKVANTAADGVTVLFKDAAGNALLATGTTVPTDSGAGYAKGCLFIDTDVAAGTSGLYVNIGSTTECNFNLVSNAAD